MKKIILAFVAIALLFILILVINYFIFQQRAIEISQGRPIAQSDMVKQALMVIDIQEGTTGSYSDDEYYQMRSDEIIQTLNLLADSSAQSGVPVIYIKSVIHNVLINILNDTYAPESPGSRLDERLHVVSENVFSKDKADAFSNSALDTFLINNHINKLVLTGLDLSGCVNSTLLAAVNRNYTISLISDALLAKSDSLTVVRLDELARNGFEILSSSEYLRTLH